MTLNFRIQKQYLTNWCWAATASSISHYYSQFNNAFFWRQEDIGAQLLGMPFCRTTPDRLGGLPQCNQQADLITALRITQNFNGWQNNPVTLNALYNEVNNFRPVCCQIFFAEHNLSHFVTVFGYNGNNIVLGDPQVGNYEVDYNAFLANYRSGQWIRTYATTRAV
jgi:hypothetical protein